jgi:hypothetical protein
MNASHQTPVVKSGPGCGMWFAIISLILIMAAIVAAVMIYKGANSMIASYTDTAPLALEPIQASDEELKSSAAKVEQFGKALQQATDSTPLVLSAQDISNLASMADATGRLGIRATIEDNQLKGQVSMPLDPILPALKGRYINGKGAFSVTLAEGRLMVFMNSLEVKGKPLPESFMKQLRASNMAEEANKDPQFQQRISRIESIRIENNQMIITPRKP